MRRSNALLKTEAPSVEKPETAEQKPPSRTFVAPRRGSLAQGGIAMNECQLYSLKSKPLVALINVRGEVAIWDDKGIRPRRVFKFGESAQEASTRMQERGWRVFPLAGSRSV